MIERIKDIIATMGLSTRKFAINCGLRQNTLSNQLNGMRDLSLATIVAIANSYPEISLEWLIRGTGEMIKTNQDEEASVALATTEEVEKIIKNKDDIIDLLLSKIRELENQPNNK